MSSLQLGRDLDGNLGGAAALNDETGVRVYEAATALTAQQRSGQEVVGLMRRSTVELLVHHLSTAGAFALLAVKCLLAMCLTNEFVLVALDGLGDQSWVHLLENAHRELG